MNTMTKQEPFVSILTPVYNGAEYLEECIQSVINQTYSNWEYVIVDNCSTDESVEIAKKYADKDERIRIHHNEEFLDLLPNHNHAFYQISPDSKYCKVVHADDWIFEECVSRMVEVAEKYPTVGVVSAYRLSGNRITLDGLPYGKSYYTGKEIGRRFLLNGRGYFGAPTSVLLRSSLVRKREKFFDETYHASDQGAILDLLKESDFGFVHQVLTFARYHENSATNTIAKESYTAIHCDLKFQLDYGPYFLGEKEYESKTSKKMHLFYIRLVRNLIKEKSIEAYKNQKESLSNLGINVELGKLARYFVRELVLQSIRMFGLKMNKAQ